MGKLNGIKKLNAKSIAIWSASAVVFVALVVVGVLLWKQNERIENESSTNSASTTQDTDSLNKLNELMNPGSDSEDGHLYTEVPCEELAQITGESCDNSIPAPSYPNYTPQYTTPESTPTQPQYNAPSQDPTPTYTPTCSDYHAQYYSEFNTRLHEINSKYTSAINSAAASCGSFGGCPQKTSLEQQWASEAAQLKNSYKTSMSNVGCDPSEFVDF
jgi:hypothetical protein